MELFNNCSNDAKIANNHTNATMLHLCDLTSGSVICMSTSSTKAPLSSAPVPDLRSEFGQHKRSCLATVAFL